MADLDRNIEASSPVTITGGDESYQVDVVQEDSVNKLLVKASTVPDQLEKLTFIKALDSGGQDNMAVNGSGTPVVFAIDAPAAGQPGLIFSSLRFSCLDGGVKLDKMLGQNSALTNGILVQIVDNGNTTSFLAIKKTIDFNDHFTFGGGTFEFIVSSGIDYVGAIFLPPRPFKLRAGTADQIKITVRDNLSSVTNIHFIGEAIEDV